MDIVIGSVGVLMLLIAFVMNLMKRWQEDHPAYLALNIVGAAMACAYALLSGTIPFVILEGVWGLFAVVKFAGLMTKKAPA